MNTATTTTSPAANKPAIQGSLDHVASSKKADRALGRSIGDVVAAVEEAKAKVAEAKPAPKPATPLTAPATENKQEEPPAEAVATDSAATVTDQTPPAAPTQPTQREGQMLADIRKRERVLVEKQQRFSRDRDEFENYKRRVEGELQQAREAAALAQRDPFAWLEKYAGIRRDAFGQAAAQVQTSVQGEQYQSKVTQLEQQLNQYRQEQAQRDREAARQRELDAFEKEGRGGSTRWPLASKYKELREMGWQVALTASQRGETLSNEEVLDRIEANLAEIADLRGKPTQVKKSSSDAVPQAKQAQPTLTGQSLSDASNGQPGLRAGETKRRRIEHTVAILDQMRAKQSA